MDASDRAKKAESNQTAKPSSAAGAGPQVSKRTRPDRASELEAGLLTVVGSAEVPEAVRDANQQAVNGPARPLGRPWLGILGGLLGLGAIAAGGFAYLWSARQLPNAWQARLDQMIGSTPSPTAPASPTPDPNKTPAPAILPPEVATPVPVIVPALLIPNPEPFAIAVCTVPSDGISIPKPIP